MKFNYSTRNNSGADFSIGVGAHTLPTLISVYSSEIHEQNREKKQLVAKESEIIKDTPNSDIALATAILAKDTEAIIVFEKDYYDYLVGIAFRVHPVFGKNPDEWWSDFLDFLAGYSQPNGKLEKYHGKSALRFWLRVVLWNFLRRRPIPKNTEEISEDIPAIMPDKDNLELSESIALFTGLVRDSLQIISERDRLILSMIYIDGMPKKDIAVVFRIHPGQIGRRETIAIETFRNELTARLNNLPRDDLREEIMGGCVNNPKEFSEALVDALKQFRK